jgi:hypothetical protein
MRKILLAVVITVTIVSARAQHTLTVQINSENVIALRKGNAIVTIDITNCKDSIPSVGTVIGIYGDYMSDVWKYEPKFQPPLYDDFYDPDYIIINGKGVENTSKERHHVSGTIIKIDKK